MSHYENVVSLSLLTTSVYTDHPTISQTTQRSRVNGPLGPGRHMIFAFGQQCPDRSCYLELTPQNLLHAASLCPKCGGTPATSPPPPPPPPSTPTTYLPYRHVTPKLDTPQQASIDTVPAQDRSTYHFNGLVWERCNSITNALELHISLTDPSISHIPPRINYFLWKFPLD